MDWLGCQDLLLYSLNFGFKIWLRAPNIWIYSWYEIFSKLYDFTEFLNQVELSLGENWEILPFSGQNFVTSAENKSKSSCLKSSEEFWNLQLSKTVFVFPQNYDFAIL